MNQLRPARPATEPETLRIGQLATRAEVSVETLRFYEREGLLERPYQHPSGYRAYPVGEVEKVQAIRRAQALGFRLAEIRDLLRAARKGQVSEHAARKLGEIDANIAQLVLARQELALLVEYRCDRLLGCSCGQSDCPVHPVDEGTQRLEATRLSAPVTGGRKTGLLAGGAAAAACAVCCAPLIGGLLAALGIPALTVSGGAEIGLAGAAVAATGVGVMKFRKWPTRAGGPEAR